MPWRQAFFHEPFDVLELLGMAAGLIAAALVIHYAADLPALLDLAVVAVAVGPFLARRQRRASREGGAAG